MPTAGTASAATGVISMVLLTAVVVLGVLVNRQGRLPGLPRFAHLSLHRYLSLLAVGFLAVHILTAIAIPLAGVGLAAAVVPFITARQPLWVGLGAVSFDLLIALAVTSLLRRHLGRRAWRAVHWLAYGCWPAALAHSIGIGPGLRGGRLLDLAATCVLAGLAAVCWRLVSTWRAARQSRLAPASAPTLRPRRSGLVGGRVGGGFVGGRVGGGFVGGRMGGGFSAEGGLEPAAGGAKRLVVDPIACTGHGLCAELLPEIIALDQWGYPVLADQPVPPRLARRAVRAVTDCPVLALRLTDAYEQR